MSVFGNTGAGKPGKGNIMDQHFDMNNSRRGSSPPFQEHTDIPSRITPQDPTDAEAALESKPAEIPVEVATNGTTQAIPGVD
jgi:hypothetical protein